MTQGAGDLGTGLWQSCFNLVLPALLAGVKGAQGQSSICISFLLVSVGTDMAIALASELEEECKDHIGT